VAQTPELLVFKLCSFLFTVITPKDESSMPDESDTYTDWRRRFAWERLTAHYLLGLVANPAFIVMDVLLHPQH
jgi:hypothetical protein